MSRRAAQRRRGLTLTEVLVAVGVAAIILLGVITTNLQLLRSGVRITQQAEMETQIRRALDRFGRDVRMATAIRWNGASDITLTVPTLAGATTQVTYAWTAAAGSFFVVPGASSAATTGRVELVRGIPAAASGGAGLVFTRYDRDGAAATTDGATKRLQVSMTLRRSVATTTADQAAVSASYTLRNKPVE